MTTLATPTKARGRYAQQVRARRPPKPPVDVWRPFGVDTEEERRLDGTLVRAVTVFLAGSECPFTCVFCDLWRYTIDGPTPQGAIPAQLRLALDGLDGDPANTHLKLYNASNFFDARAVPVVDDPEILDLVEPFGRVIVECHPRLIRQRCFDFAERLDGRLEVGMGLETIHPDAQPQLGKGATVDDFRRAAGALRGRGIAWRAFILVGAPFIPADDTVPWVERTAAFALEHGAAQVSLIPVRGGNGELEHLASEGVFIAPTLEQVEDAFDRCLALEEHFDGVVTVDPWDLEHFVPCDACGPSRIDRLVRMNLSGRRIARQECSECRSGGRKP